MLPSTARVSNRKKAIRFATAMLGSLLLIAAGQSTGQPTSISDLPSDALKAYVRSHLSLNRNVTPGTSTRISVAIVKSSHGREELDVVYVTGQEWCGSGGCTMLILAPAGASFKMLGRATIVQLPIRVLRTTSHGYPDVGVLVAGGGIQTGYEAVLSFNGRRYPRNPSMPPARKLTHDRGKVVIADTNDSVPLYD